MTQREKLKELLEEAAQKMDCPQMDEVADFLLANGVMVVDTNTVDIVTNLEPIQTAFGMPLNELADLIRAKQEKRIIVPPCKVGDTVYCILPEVFDKPCETKIYSITIQAEGIIMRCGVTPRPICPQEAWEVCGNKGAGPSESYRST